MYWKHHIRIYSLIPWSALIDFQRWIFLKIKIWINLVCQLMIATPYFTYHKFSVDPSTFVWRPVAELRVSTISSCWQGPLKILFAGPPRSKSMSHQKEEVAQACSSRAQWHMRLFCAFQFFETTKICFGSTKMENLPHWGPRRKLLTGPFPLNPPLLETGNPD